MRFAASLGLLSVLSGLAAAQAQPQPSTLRVDQAVPPLIPGRIEQLAPPSTPRLAPSLRPAPPAPARGPGAEQRVRVSSVRFTGNTALPDADLLPLVQPLIGQEVALAAVEDARIRVISAYGRAGYPFVTASAGLTPEAGGALLVLSVTEGHIASVKLDGDVGPAGTQVLRFLEPLVGGGPITTSRLERALLLTGDIPGLTVRSVVRPLQGGEAGALELVALLTRRPFSGYLAVDNRGYKLTGPLQALAAVGANSFTSLGERIEATLFLAEGAEQTFGQIAGEGFVGGSGLRVRLYAGHGLTRPGSFLRATGYEGHTTALGVAAQYPIIRSRPMNLFATAQFDYLDSEVRVDPNVAQSLDEVRTLRAGLEGSALDSLMPFAPAAAMTAASLRIHRGVSVLGATGAADTPGPARVQSDFGFLKWTGELSRTQPIWMPTEGAVVSIYGIVAGQHSSDILPLAEKYQLGGGRLGRGFYAGQVTGDSAIVASVELQLDVRPAPIALPGLSGNMADLNPTAQFYLFYDHGRTWENLDTDPDRRVESFGAGVRFFLTESTQFDIEGVRRRTRRVDAAGSNVSPLGESAAFFRLLTRF